MPRNATISYPRNTDDRLCDVAGSIRCAARLLENLPDEVMQRDGGYLVQVLQQLAVIEREVRAIHDSGAALGMEAAHV